MLWFVIRLIFKTSSVTPDFFYVFNLILSFPTCSQSFNKICVWEVSGANVLKLPIVLNADVVTFAQQKPYMYEFITTLYHRSAFRAKDHIYIDLCTRFSTKLGNNFELQQGYVWVIDQVWGQDGWILAEFSFCVFMDRDKVEVINSQKKNEANTQPSWPSKLGQ